MSHALHEVYMLWMHEYDVKLLDDILKQYKLAHIHVVDLCYLGS